MNLLKTALIQQKYYGSKDATNNATCNFIKEASQKGAKLVILQELHQNEYFCQSENVDFSILRPGVEMLLYNVKNIFFLLFRLKTQNLG